MDLPQTMEVNFTSKSTEDLIMEKKTNKHVITLMLNDDK